MNFARILLDNKREYNGHKQFEISYLSLEDGLLLRDELEKLESDYSFVLEVWKEGFSIYQKDFWAHGEHPSGHTDKLIIGVESYEN